MVYVNFKCEDIDYETVNLAEKPD